MSDSYERYENEHGGGFMMGLLTGTVLGAGLGILLAPKSGSELRGQIGEQARNLGHKASEQYRRASESAGSWAERGREMVGQAREAVSRGVEEARGYAGSATSGASPGGGPSGSGRGSTSGSTPGSTGSTGSSDFGRS